MKLSRCLWFLGLLLFGGCKETIFHDLSEAEANQVVVALGANSIPTTKEKDTNGWKIAVARSQASAALKTLSEKRLIKKPEAAAASASSFIQSREEKQQIMSKQLSLDLKDTIERLPKVLEARVHLNISKEPDWELSAAKKRQSASVLIIAEDLQGVDALQVKGIVGGAAGLVPDEIIVVVSTIENARVIDANQTGKINLEKDNNQIWNKFVELPRRIFAAMAVFALTIFLILKKKSFRKKTIAKDKFSKQEEGEELLPVDLAAEEDFKNFEVENLF